MSSTDEVEAQQQRRLARLFRGHPQVRVPRVYTDLLSRRVLVTEYVDGLRSAPGDRATRRSTARPHWRDRVPFLLRSPRRERIVAGDPHLDNCLLCPDGRVCFLDFALLRGLEHEYLDGERAVMRAVVDADPDAVDAALSTSAISLTPSRTTPRRRSSTSRRRASGCWPRGSVGSTPVMSAARLIWVIRRAPRGFRCCGA